MNKRIVRNCVLMCIATVLMGVVLSLYMATTEAVPAADNAAVYFDGTYTASASAECGGFTSNVSVTVTVIGGKVSSVTADAPDDTPEKGGAAATQLAARLAEAGTDAGVDAVSGCTATSDAVFAAFENCLEQAAQQRQ